MLGPFGVDAAAITDVIGVVWDVADRVRAPRRILQELTYVINRETRTGIADAGQLSRFTADREDSAQSLLKQFDFLQDPHREQNGVGSALSWRSFVKLAARRDLFTNILETAQKFQSNHLEEKILYAVYEQKEVLEKLQNQYKIKSCENVKGAKALIKCPSTYLRALNHKGQGDYAAVHNFVEPTRAVPVWGHAPECPHLLYHRHGKKRLELLLEVAKAMKIAHSHDWYHGRLAPSMILRLKSRSSMTMNNRNLQPIVVLNFFHEENGCRACGACVGKPLENPTTYSFRHNYDGEVTLEQDDVLIFGNLICWIYASEKYDFSKTADDTCNRKILEHVPWPLHFLVVDCLERPSLSMSIIHLWLSHLYNEHLDPHSFDQPFIPLNSNPSPTSTSLVRRVVHSESGILHSCALRAVLQASFQDVPEAIVHLGNYWKEKALTSIGLQTENAQDSYMVAMTKAHNCYLAASNLGSEEGLLCVAQLYAAYLNETQVLPDIQPPPTIPCILSTILRSALKGNRRAFYYLWNTSKHGLRVLTEDANAFLTMLKRASPKEPVSDLELLKVVQCIGRVFRVGDLGIPQCEYSALGWLGLAAERGFPPAKFDLGMYLVQTATSLCEAVQGVEKLKLLCNSIPHESALRASFRVGRWLYYGLPHEFTARNIADTEDSTDIQDRARSLSYIRKAADGGITDAKVLYAVILRKGVAGVLDQDVLASDKMLSEMKDCPSAQYARAIHRITLARKAYEKLSRTQSFALSAAESTGSALNERTSSNTTSSTEEGLPGRKYKGRVFSMLGRGRRSMQEKQSRDRGMYGDDESNSKPNTNGNMNHTACVASDSFEREIEEGLREPNGDMTRKGIAQCFVVCENILTRGPLSFKTKWRSEQFNPYPYYTAARLMIKHSTVWAECASSGHSAANEERKILKRAEGHLRSAIFVPKKRDTDGQSMWEKLRIDWRQEDLSVIRKAKSELKQLQRLGV